MKHGGAADRAEPEQELGSVISDTQVFRRDAEDLKGSREAGQRREDAASPSLTGEAVADADASRFTLNLDAQLPAGARGSAEDPHVRDFSLTYVSEPLTTPAQPPASMAGPLAAASRLSVILGTVAAAETNTILSVVGPHDG
jgi:hypothetical protein